MQVSGIFVGYLRLRRRHPTLFIAATAVLGSLTFVLFDLVKDELVPWMIKNGDVVFPLALTNALVSGALYGVLDGAVGIGKLMTFAIPVPVLPPTHPRTHLPTYLPTYLPTHPPTLLPTYLPTHPSTYVPTYLPTHPSTYLPTYLPTYMPTQQTRGRRSRSGTGSQPAFLAPWYPKQRGLRVLWLQESLTLGGVLPSSFRLVGFAIGSDRPQPLLHVATVRTLYSKCCMSLHLLSALGV